MCIAVHAGFHKTGTTSFQDLIRANTANTPSTLKFSVPDSPLGKRLRQALASYHLSPSAVGLAAVKAAFETIRNDALDGGADTLFVSEENLSGLARGPWERGFYTSCRDVLETVCDSCSGHDLTFLFSTRNPETWIRSLHAHMTRACDLRMTFDDFSRMGVFRSIDWASVISSATKGLDAKTVVTSLEATKDRRLGALSDFLDPFLDEQALAAWRPVAASHKSLPPKVVEFAQSRIVRNLPGELRWFVIRQFNSLYKLF